MRGWEEKGKATVKVKCPYCGSEEILYGKSRTGKQRLLCRNPACSRKIFQMEYANNACKPGTKEKIVEMAMNGAGVRDTGRVLDISPNTVCVSGIAAYRQDIPMKPEFIGMAGAVVKDENKKMVRKLQNKNVTLQNC